MATRVDRYEELLDTITDPKIVGPGQWVALHAAAARAKTVEDNKRVERLLISTIENFTCSECRDHARAYLAKNPTAKYYEMFDKDGRCIAMAYYIWRFHNFVNERLGKPFVPWEYCKRLYAEVCEKGCSADVGVETKTSKESREDVRTPAPREDVTILRAAVSRPVMARPPMTNRAVRMMSAGGYY